MSIPSDDASVPSAGQKTHPRAEATSITRYIAEAGSPRNLLFLFLVIVSLLVFWTPLRMLWEYSHRVGEHDYDKYSHTLLIPLITLVLVIMERKKILANVQYCIRAGAILLFAGLIMDGAGVLGINQLGVENALSVRLLGLVAFWIGGFVLCYGVPACRAGAFPLLFLLLTVPIPSLWLDAPISTVRDGSTEVCSLIFNLAGVPFLRNGYDFTLADISIEVAKECSGIHSTLALFIVSLVAGHLFLTSSWKKGLLVLFVVPVVCFTNGLRIAGLTLLSVYVDPRFMHSNLHHEGGVGFFLLALLFMFAILRLMRRRRRVKGPRSAVTLP
jgi:exosortase